MADGGDLSFETVRRMSVSQLDKLTKKQLVSVLKDAVDVADQNPSISSSSLKKIVADAVSDAITDIRRELISESKRLIAEAEIKWERNLVMVSESIHSTLKTDVLNELQDREHRKNNIVVFGMPEQLTTNAPGANCDKEDALNIFSKIGIEDVKVERCFRLGNKTSRQKPRPMKIILSSQMNRDLILRAAPKLGKLSDTNQFRKVFLKPDLTPQQQEEERNLRQELKCRRDNGENVMIKNGKIILRTSD